MVDRLLIGQKAAIRVPVVERLQQFVQLADPAGAVEHPGHGRDPGDPLAGVPECLGRFGEEPLVQVRDFQEILADLGTVLLTSKVPSQIDVLLHPGLYTFDARLVTLVKAWFGCVRRIRGE